MRRSASILAAFAILTAHPAAAQSPAMPDDPRLQEAYLAWDAGDYPTALRGYLEVLKAADGLAHLEEIALLTGEVFAVSEITTDGTGISVAPDGGLGAYRVTGADGRPVTKVLDLQSGTEVREVEGAGVVLGPEGRVARLRVVSNPAVEAAAAAVAAAPDRGSRFAAQRELAWEEAKASEVETLAGGRWNGVQMGGRVPLALSFAQRTGQLFAVAAPEDAPGEGRLYRLDGGAPEEIDLGGPVTGALVSADGTAFVGVARGDLLVRAANGERLPFRDASDPSLSRGGVLAFLSVRDGVYRVEVADLTAASLESRVVFESDKQVAGPRISPDGRHVAFEFMDLHDWEVLAVATDGSGERRLSLEIQHDRRIQWVDDTHLLAAKGEGRHMRSYLYALDGSAPVKLFHNNSVRTIAPEYEWAIAPGTGKLLIVAERDGDTVSPERGVYLLDLGRKVSRSAVEARLEEALANEVDLRERGARAFAPLAADVTAVTEQISVGRIFQYARDVYGFGSKHITMPGNALAIDYYVEKLRSFGYEPELQWFEPRGTRTANVIVRIPGTVDPELVYVASSHFDSTQRGPGADDDSSGATALLEVARVLRDHPMPATIELAFFTGEEAGLLGSREYVRRAVADGKRIVGALNNDMVGWMNDNRLDNTIRYSNPGIKDIQHAAAMQFSELITYDALYYKSTDAAAYYEAYGDIVGGIGSYPVLGNPHYHQWTDRLETISQKLVAEVARTTAATLMLLASSPARLAGLAVEGGMATWTPAPERGISAYEVRWETDGGWRAAQVTEPRAELDGLTRGGAVWVRALAARGTHGLDWAKGSPRP